MMRTFAFLLMIASLAGCKAVYITAERPAVQVETIPGPEDLFFDTIGGDSFLWVSCDPRRDTEEGFGEIMLVPSCANCIDAGIQANNVVRTGEPEGLIFHPHGIWVGEVKGQKMLYVISHDNEGQTHSIYQYAVNGAVLEWVRAYHSPLLISPNSVMAFPDGSLLVTNDSRKRDSKIEKLLAKKVCTIVYFSPEGEASIAADHITYANGINYRGQDVYISSTTGNRLLHYQFADGKLTHPEKVCRLPGPDNIRWHKNNLTIACHPRSFAFIRHVNHADKPSPSQIYEVDPATGKRTILYAERGTHIPAASTGIVVGDQLWMGQVFNPWLQVVDLGSGTSAISLKK